MADFPYSKDVGVASYNDIVAFGRKSGVSFSVSSTTSGDHGNQSYHYTGNAVDLTSSAGEMIRLAAWFYNYAPYELELIHSGGSGYFVKNGKKVAASYYGATTVSEHYNHVHVAMTESGIKAAEGNASNAQAANVQLVSATDAFSSWKPPCAIPALMFASCFFGVIGWLISLVV